MRKRLPIGALLPMAPASGTLARGDTGHEVVREITFRGVSDATRERIVAALVNDARSPERGTVTLLDTADRDVDLAGPGWTIPF